MRYRGTVAMAVAVATCSVACAALAQPRVDLGNRDMPVWGHDYTEKASELFPDLPYNQTAYVRTRINALMEYLAQMQGK